MKSVDLPSDRNSALAFDTPGKLEQAKRNAEKWSTRELLSWASEVFGSDLEIASAFGAEGIVLIDIASHVMPDLRVFILNTGYLFPETLELLNKVEARYGIRVDKVVPEISVDSQAALYQPALWGKDPDLCCEIRKVRPLRRKLSTLKAWVTAIRRDQTVHRRNVPKLHWDDNFQLVKINPLADWTHEMVWSYIRQHRLAYNPLHDQNYPTLGCIQCTVPIRPGEDLRSGRWSGFAKQECGLHFRSSTSRTRPMTADVSPPPEE